MDHSAVEDVLQRAVVGATVAPEDLERALAHVARCDVCRTRFEVERLAVLAEGDDLAEVADDVDPAELFERALTAALSDPDPVVRLRAAERLGGERAVDLPALVALARTVAADPAPQVRGAALAALDRLDAAVSLPERVIEAWSRAPAEAAPYLADALDRLARRPLARLAASPAPGKAELDVTGEEGIEGHLAVEENRLRLTLEGLPDEFEKTRPVVLVPLARESGAPEIEWRGRTPGLVPAETPVVGGRLDVSLGNLMEPADREHELAKRPPRALFARMYLVKRETV